MSNKNGRLQICSVRRNPRIILPMRTHIIIAAVLAIVLANMLVFGAIGTQMLPPTPRAVRVVARKTYTPNPAYARRMTTQTPVPTPTPTLRPTEYPQRDPRVSYGAVDE